jgi:hypothetical protein
MCASQLLQRILANTYRIAYANRSKSMGRTAQMRLGDKSLIMPVCFANVHE